jgi:hypothetical protein
MSCESAPAELLPVGGTLETSLPTTYEHLAREDAQHYDFEVLLRSGDRSLAPSRQPDAQDREGRHPQRIGLQRRSASIVTG